MIARARGKNLWLRLTPREAQYLLDMVNHIEAGEALDEDGDCSGVSSAFVEKMHDALARAVAKAQIEKAAVGE